MKLQDVSIEILGQLIEMTDQFSQEEYTRSLDLLSNNSVGRHLRHILEFYDLAVRAGNTGRLNYDKRDRNLALENSPREAVSKMKELIVLMRLMKEDMVLKLEASYSSDTKNDVKITTTFYRELLYNVEHAVHHMAIMAIAVKVDFRHIRLSKNFGVAYSTVQHKQTA
ncbi:DinB family protein [Dyadobacter frigoris]|uniref:DinB family protein n=1 Tax=Dyadobacter frigoris TaxID=2576211 RepID=A0A4U6D871_9BACT|nr:DinB family protein [Dyadobacter frigoris]TKT90334.1 DinB family protein [Dyadobacter frigoris]GLU52577.1 hypothetical protein Dfri01_20380 [Dyadobacter frigoris]